MFRVFAILVGLVLLLQFLGWFFTVALPFFVRLLGDCLSIAYDMLSDAISWLSDAWRGLRGLFVRSSLERPDATKPEPNSLLESADNPDINLPSQPNPTSAMWPFGSNNSPVSSGSSPSPRQGSFLTTPELDKLKGELYKAQNQVKTLEVNVKQLVQQNALLNDRLRLEEQNKQSLNLEIKNGVDALASREIEFSLLLKRFDEVSVELEKIKPFAAIKTDQRRMIYTVSPELHKKWQSIMRDTTRLQVLELLGQPTEILAVTSGGALPIQLVRKGVPAPRPELMQHVTSLVVGDGLLKDWVRGVGRTAWVYADDTIAPGVIFFASESDGGQVFRIFPPEC
jgi:hypothetical protein